MFWWLLFFGLAILVAVVGAVVRWRVHLKRREGKRLTDEMVRRIERTGRLEWDDEGLDWERIREEEDAFWSETWDEPEPW